jgi:hypothetical protein
MRKRLISPVREATPYGSPQWLYLPELADVELTSEDPAAPIEGALLPGSRSGWRAAEPGQQTIRILFTRPQPLRRVSLRFEELHVPRTQEYVLRWSSAADQTPQQLIRQQWNFSPDGSTSQAEDHHVDLPAVTAVELSITPDISGGPAVASLAQLRLA